MRAFILTAVAVCVLPAAAQAQDFRWHGRLAPGKRVEVKGVNGDVRAVATTGSEVEVTAAKHARRSARSIPRRVAPVAKTPAKWAIIGPRAPRTTTSRSTSK